MSQETLVSVYQKKKSPRDLFNPVITPENIPQFTIPSLAILENSRMFPAEKSFAWRSHQWHQDDRILNQKSRRCSDPVCKNTHGISSVRIVDLPDPVTRAAMSLPHLPKISTPYGFLTLGESPHIARKESIFFKITSVGMESTENGHSLQNPLISENLEKNLDCIHVIPETKNMGHVPKCTDKKAETSVGTSIQKNSSDSRKLLFRRSSTPICNSRIYVQVNKREWAAPFLTQRSNSLPKITIRRSSQSLFQYVLKKHLKSLKSSSVELVENVEI